MNEEFDLDEANQRFKNSQKLQAAGELVKLLKRLNRHGVSQATMDAVAREWRVE